MENDEIKRILLFLLQSAQNHERRVLELTAAHRALAESAIPSNPLGVWEKYQDAVEKLIRADAEATARTLARFDDQIRQVNSL